MAEKIKVEWEIEDGYAGPSRTQVARIDPTGFVGMNRKEAVRELNECMEEEFRERVHWECKDYEASLTEIMQAAAKIQAEEEAEGDE